MNGVHFDDSTAVVLDEDGATLSGSTALRLGNVWVEIAGDVVKEVIAKTNVQSSST